MIPDRKTLRPLRQPAFILCVVVLGMALLGMNALERAMGLALTKQSIPLARPLDQMAAERLAPYRVCEKITIDDPDLRESLGTGDYIQWVLEDPRRSSTDPAREALLFVTYYAAPDRIPHVPEECYLGSGFQRLATETMTLAIPGQDKPRTISARSLLFSRADVSPWTGGGRVPVVYLFRVNGVYAGSRDEARLVLNRNLFGKASYFAKVELVFNRSAGRLTLDQAQAAARDILSVVLPVLERDHWPAWPPEG